MGQASFSLHGNAAWAAEMAFWYDAIHHWLCVWFVRKPQRMKISQVPYWKADLTPLKAVVSSGTYHWEKQLQLMKKSSEFFYLQRTDLEKPSLLSAAALCAVKPQLWDLRNSTLMLLSQLLLSQLQCMSCFRGNRPWAYYFLSCALKHFLL